MSSSSGCIKVSDVLEIMSIETISHDKYSNIPASSSEKSWSYEREKQIFTDAVYYCMVLLRQSNRLTNHMSDLLSLEATLTGHEMFEKIRNVKVQTEVELHTEVPVTTNNDPQHKVAEIPHFPNNNEIEIKEEVIDADTELDETLLLTPTDNTWRRKEQSVEKEVCDSMCVSDNDSGNRESRRYSRVSKSDKSAQEATVKNDSMDENKLPPSPLSLTESDEYQTSSIASEPSPVAGKRHPYISFDVKKKVIALAQKHPDWSLKMLQKHGCEKLSCLSQLNKWKRQIEEGGTQKEKYEEINKRTYERFVKALSKSETVTVEKLRQWAIQTSRDLYGAKLYFNAARTWAYNFKKVYKIKTTPDGNLILHDNQTIAKSRRLVESNRRKSTKK